MKQKRDWLIVVGCIWTVVALATAIWGFTFPDLTPSRYFILRILLAVAVAFTAGSFTGAMSVNNEWIKGIVVTATGGFAVFVLFPFLFQVPQNPTRTLFVQLVPTRDAPLDGQFEISYDNPTLGQVRGTGANGQLIVSGWPSDVKVFSILSFLHPRFLNASDPNGEKRPWDFEIPDDGKIKLRVTPKSQKPPPTQEEAKAIIPAWLMSTSTRTDATVDEEFVRAKKFTVRNNAGKQLVVWLYDCSKLLPNAAVRTDAGSEQTTPGLVSDIRLADTQENQEFGKFDVFDNRSGWFAVFVDVQHNGQWTRLPIGVYNFFNQPYTELEFEASVLQAIEWKPFSDHT